MAQAINFFIGCRKNFKVFLGEALQIIFAKKMRFLVLCFILYLRDGHCKLWPRGVVHYAINTKDYDLHSQDIIMSTFESLEKEICVKFFNTPMNHNASEDHKILYVSNPDKRKTCPPDHYNYKASVVDMPIGYKCLNQRDIARIVTDMLRASIEPEQTVNSYDLMRKFQNQDTDPSSRNILSPSDRNFINAHYHNECGELVQRPVESRRSLADTLELSVDNQRYYKNKIWPFGIIMYGIEDSLKLTTGFSALRYAMTTIEVASCVVFQEVLNDDVLTPKNLLWFGADGSEIPQLGFSKGNQTISLSSMVHGAPGHNAHTLNMLMRVLGIPMMSNRYDRDNYVTVNWKHVEIGRQHYLEKTPIEAWLQNTEGEGAAYDFDSATHAPANFMCKDCSLGAQTVTPNHDHLWQRTLTIGHRTDLTPTDIETINLLYTQQCQVRFVNTR